MALNDTYSGSLTAAAQTVVADAQNTNGAYVWLQGTYTGVTIAFEGTADGGVTWGSLLGFRVDSAAQTAFANNPTLPSSITSQWYVFTGGVKQFRVRCSAIASGALQVNIIPVEDGPGLSNFVPASSAPAALADGFANPTAGNMAMDQMLFNGTTWDRGRNNVNAIAVDASSARTSSGTGVTGTNFNHTGAFIYVNITAASGTTPTLVFKVTYSIDGTTFVDLDATNAATASLTGISTAVIKVYPGLPTVAAGSCNSPLPRVWRLAWTIGGTTPSFTFTTTASYIL